MFLTPTLDRFLSDMEYPATRDDLLREAVRDGLAPDDRAALGELPDQSFSAAWHIRHRLARRRFADAFATAQPVAA